jgi:tetratricopeptide (TPR) repeat protein
VTGRALRPSPGIARLTPTSPSGTRDRFGLNHSSRSAEAIARFEDATFGLAAHRPSVAADIANALARDEHLVAAHVLKGFANLILACAETGPAANDALRRAEVSLLASDGTADERALVEALRCAVAGSFAAGAARFDAQLDINPAAFLPAKLAHALRFMLGDAPGMLASSARILDRWSPLSPGYGFLLGCHAFALEELGHFESAERIGQRAVEIEPADAWGLHAVGHVHEMQGRTAEGIAWLEGARPAWSRCNNFSFHIAWHLALFRLECGEKDEILRLYDEEVRPNPTDDFRDMANAVSLLWRLEEHGVAVGGRWDELREIALRRRRDTTLAFASLHNLLALVAIGELEAAWDLVRALEDKAEGPDTDQALVMDSVAIDLARVILDLALHRAPSGDFARLVTRLPAIGGSNAQRDVFVRALARFAADRGDRNALEQILAARRRLKRDDRFVSMLDGRFPPAVRRSADHHKHLELTS